MKYVALYMYIGWSASNYNRRIYDSENC